MNDEMTKKVLLRTAELVDRGWCQGTLGSRLRTWEPSFNGEEPRHFQVGISYPAGLAYADRVCLDGALMLAVHEVTGEDLDRIGQVPLYRAAGDAIKTQVARTAYGGGPVDWPDVGLTSYVSWNDESGRTAEEVAALCRKAAE